MDLADDLFLTNLEVFERQIAVLDAETARRINEIRGKVSPAVLVDMAEAMVTQMEELRRQKDERDQAIERWLRESGVRN